jgi:hypothetical protein
VAVFRDLFDRPLPRRRLLEYYAFTLSFATLIGGLARYLERQFEFSVEKIGSVNSRVDQRDPGWADRPAGEALRRKRLALIGFAVAIGYGLLGAARSLRCCSCSWRSRRSARR